MEGKIKRGTVMETVDKLLDDFDDAIVSEDYFEVFLPTKIDLCDVAIVDVETSGFNPGYGGLLTLGVVFDDLICIRQRTSSGGFHEVFRQDCIDFLSDIDKSFYAYNRSFEERWLGRRFKFGEIEINGFGNRSKDSCVSFRDFHYGEGSDVIDEWRNWKSKGDPKYIKEIVKHNFNCLIKETSLFMVNNDFLDCDVDC